MDFIAALYNLIVTYRLTVGVTELFLWYGRQLKFSTPNRLRNSADNDGRTHVTSRATVVCATMHANHSIIDAISSWCQNDPAEVVIVAAPQAYPRLRDMTEAWSFSVPVRIIKAPVTNKRHQLCIGGQQAPTDYLVITDDDMRWEANVVENLVEALDTDSSLGCVFPDIDNEPVGKSMTFWERLTSIKHTGEVVDFHCSLSVDGGIVYHYGGTVAYRSHILQDERFIADFTGETWRRQVLNSGDDQFLCRWMVNEGWSIARRKAYGCIARARSRNDWRHLLQVIRWSRNDWRASLSTLIWERTIWRRHPFTAWLRVVNLLRGFAPIVEILYLVCHSHSWLTCVILIGRRLIRYVPHFVSNPGDLPMLLLFVIYLYAYSILNLYALFTLTNTGWV